MCVCVCVSVPAVNAQRLQCNETNSFYRLLATFSWILIRGFAKLLSQAMASLTHNEASCCNLFRIFHGIVCSTNAFIMRDVRNVVGKNFRL